jgi:rod shape-determining protein MreC
VVQVENVAQGAFGRVVCQPLAGIDRHRQLLIVMSDQPLPPRLPAEAPKANGNTTSRKNLPRMEPVPPPPLPPQPLAPAVAPKQNAGAPAGAPAARNPAATAPAAPAPAGRVPGAMTPAAGAPAAGAPAAGSPAAGSPATNAAVRPKEGA